jgi:peptidoglycan hydrolase-like protein with peptidoglycan-binding domain
VNRTVLFVPFCLTIITGCAISDNSETEIGKPAIAVPAAEDSQAPISGLNISEPAAAMTATRGLTQEEIRQLQIRLKDVGFDPGPTDGVPGAKTRAAFARLQSSCAAWNSIAENSAQGEVGALDPKLPASGKDIQMVQRSLHGAGFDLGPVDGILGARTKTVLMAVQNTCPKIRELADNLSFAVSVLEKQNSAGPGLTSGSNAQSAIHPPASTGASKQTSTSIAAQTNEEIRILQLRLRDAGFDPGPFDGIMGAKTRSALQQYEASQRGKKTKISLTTEDAKSHY